MKNNLLLTDGDGQIELVVGYADRVVRCFKWLRTQDEVTEAMIDKLTQIGKWQLDGQVGLLGIPLLCPFSKKEGHTLYYFSTVGQSIGWYVGLPDFGSKSFYPEALNLVGRWSFKSKLVGKG